MTAPRASAGSTEADLAPEDLKRTIVFSCEQCGAELRFNIGAQTLHCSHCGFNKTLTVNPDTAVEERDYRKLIRGLTERRKQAPVDGDRTREIECSSCGAVVRFEATLTSTACAFCGIPLQLETAHDPPHRVLVDGVLPFSIDRPTARQALTKWVRSRWFAPTGLKHGARQGNFNGVYTPYWTFDSLTMVAYTGLRGTDYWDTQGSGKNRRRVRKTRWSPVSGQFQRLFDDVLALASTALPTRRAVRLEPWPLDRCVSFNPELLAGLLARTYDIEPEHGFETACQRIERALQQDVRQRIGGDRQQITSLNTTHEAVTCKQLLLPVWLMTYRFRAKAYQVLVNGATGEVDGERPYSWIKIGLAVLAGVILVGIASRLLR